ncbi:hypothetical protein BDZ88DRAFT_227976 [Geranomyces variabilis]|nr:hypothetical protein BDZ88DRAFT_227976 [Geranomyces variabilis]
MSMWVCVCRCGRLPGRGGLSERRTLRRTLRKTSHGVGAVHLIYAASFFPSPSSCPKPHCLPLLLSRPMAFVPPTSLRPPPTSFLPRPPSASSSDPRRRRISRPPAMLRQSRRQWQRGWQKARRSASKQYEICRSRSGVRIGYRIIRRQR